jgi:hypothetical protein
MSFIDEYFDKIFFINLPEDTERKEKLHEQFEKFNITNFECIDAIKIDELPDKVFYRNFIKSDSKYIFGQLGCARSHLKAVKTAYERNYKRVLILEDDVVFLKDPSDVLSNGLKNVKNWNLLYFGGLIEPHYRNQIVCSHAYAVEQTVMPDIICMAENSGMEYDNFLAKIIQHMSYNYNISGKYDICAIGPFNTIVQDKNFKSHIQQ